MAVNIFQDLDYLASTLGLPRWSRAVNCCAKEGENLEKLQQLCPGLLPSGPLLLAESRTTGADAGSSAFMD